MTSRDTESQSGAVVVTSHVVKEEAINLLKVGQRHQLQEVWLINLVWVCRGCMTPSNECLQVPRVPGRPGQLEKRPPG